MSPVRKRPLPPVRGAAGLSILEAAAVRQASWVNHCRLLRLITQYSLLMQVSWTSSQKLGAAAVNSMVACYRDGEPASTGSLLIAALRHLYSTSLSLPRACRAVRGWSKLRPPLQRLPLPRVAMFAIAGVLCHQGL